MIKQTAFVLICLLALLSAISRGVRSQDTFMSGTMPYSAFDRLPHTDVTVSGGTLRVGFAPGPLSLSHERIIDWLKTSAKAVSIYYGKFPVPLARVLIVPTSGRGVRGGQAFGYRGPAIRLIVGSDSTPDDLKKDWKAVHEMVHLALPDVPEENLWLAEGLAVYVEPIARVQAGDLTPEKIWTDMARDMPKGLPEAGDAGLDQTHTWGRTYWGGAIFYLLADVDLRKRSGNRVGVQQAMRAVVDAGGTHDKDWSIDKILSVADKATGYSTMTDLYMKLRDAPIEPDLSELWKQLGVVRGPNGRVTSDDAAPLAAIRLAITARPADASVQAN